ncbi:hypothetical protein BM1_09975 [Bipolaris maydis]|nr:hypothetical protein BM1_09975 [Bipolaris maydis]
MYVITCNHNRDRTGIASLGSYGLGVPQQFATALTGVTDALGPHKGFFFSVLFVNMFQAIVSALYLLCNNLLTVMVVAAEWNAYYNFRRKALRVSALKGIQGSTFFLSLPYRCSVTLMVLSGLLHFFIYQSVFVVQPVAYLPRYEPQRFIQAPGLDVSCIGFSSLGTFLALATGFVLVVYFVVVGFTFKYEMPINREKAQEAAARLFRMPVVSRCSAAISANCHAHAADTDCGFLPVQWRHV